MAIRKRKDKDGFRMNFLRSVMIVSVVIISGCAHIKENSCKEKCKSEQIACIQGGRGEFRTYSSLGCKEIYDSCISACSSK